MSLTETITNPAVRVVDGVELPAAGTYALDASHSQVGFAVRHLMVSKTRGRFSDFAGTIEIGENPLESSVEVTIQAASIDTRNEQRDGELRTNDFLAPKEYPEISFVSTGVAQTGATSLVLTGDLTVKGVTKPISVPFEFTGSAQDPFGNTRIGFEGSTTLLRKDWGLTWNAALETGGVLVSDKIKLQFDISAIKNA